MGENRMMSLGALVAARDAGKASPELMSRCAAMPSPARTRRSGRSAMSLPNRPSPSTGRSQALPSA
ncbi:MAG: hypothetical protein RID59_20275 [Hoeflea sp.]